MAKEKEKKVVYYTDEGDNLAEIKKEVIPIDESFKFVRKNIFWRLCSFIVHRIIMVPIAYLYCKIKFSLKIVNKQALKQAKKSGVFVYGNHTLMGGDAFIPNLVAFPKRAYVIVSSANISTKGTKTFILMNGAIPLPTTFSAMRPFMAAVEERCKQRAAVVIYPEASIWPYYTGIRPFKSVSFKYPVRLNQPSYSMTVTYQRKKRKDKPRATVYIDGPFYPNADLPEKERQEDLRSRVYEKMCERAKNSTYSHYTYVKKENTND